MVFCQIVSIVAQRMIIENVAAEIEYNFVGILVDYFCFWFVHFFSCRIDNVEHQFLQ